MPESKTSKKVTKAIKVIDKIVRDFQKDIILVKEAIKELQEDDEDEKSL